MKNQTTYEKLLIEYAKKIKQLQSENNDLKLSISNLQLYELEYNNTKEYLSNVLTEKSFWSKIWSW